MSLNSKQPNSLKSIGIFAKAAALGVNVKRLAHPIFLMFLIYTLGCVQRGPLRDLDTSKRIQTIAVTKKHYIYAQGDVVLNDDSLNKKLSELNEQWKKDLSTASTYRTWTTVALITQFFALGMCAASSRDRFAWCVGSVGVAYLATHPLDSAAVRTKHSVVEQFNQSRASSP